MPRAIRIAQASSAVQPCAIPQNFVIASGAKQSIVVMEKDGLLRRGACHRARIRATRWLLAMTENVKLRAFRSYQSSSPKKITLADFHPVMAKDAVSGGGVEVEIRERKIVEELLALQRDGLIGAGGKADLAGIGAIELRRLERLD